MRYTSQFLLCISLCSTQITDAADKKQSKKEEKKEGFFRRAAKAIAYAKRGFKDDPYDVFQQRGEVGGGLHANVLSIINSYTYDHWYPTIVEEHPIGAERFTAFTTNKGGNRCAVGDYYGGIYFFDALEGKKIAKGSASLGTVTSVSLNPAGDRALSTCGSDPTEGKIRLWDDRGKEQKQYKSDALFATFSNDGKRFVSKMQESSITIADAATFKISTYLRDDPEGSHPTPILALGGVGFVYTDRIYCATWNHDDSVIASTADDASVKLWDVKSGKSLHTLTKPHRFDYGPTLTFSSDGQQLFYPFSHYSNNSGPYTYVIGKVDMRKLPKNAQDSSAIQNIVTIQETNGSRLLSSLSLSRDGSKLIAAYRNSNEIHIYDSQTGEKLAVFHDSTPAHSIKTSTIAAHLLDDNTLLALDWQGLVKWQKLRLKEMPKK